MESLTHPNDLGNIPSASKSHHDVNAEQSTASGPSGSACAQVSLHAAAGPDVVHRPPLHNQQGCDQQGVQITFPYMAPSLEMQGNSEIPRVNEGN